MKISNLIKFVAVLAVCLNLASANSLEQIKKDGVIRMGTMGTYAPFTYHNEAGDLVGYDVEIAKAVADKLGLKPKFIKASWDAMIAAFDAGKADIVFNQVTINDDRKKKYDFTLPYTATHTIVIVHKDNEDIKSFADLKGKRSAHAVTSNEGKIAEQHGAVIITAAGIVEQINLIATKRADSTIDSDLMFYEYTKQNPQAPIKIAAINSDATYMAAIVHKGNAELLNAVNKALEELRAEGKLKEISLKYFGKDISE